MKKILFLSVLLFVSITTFAQKCSYKILEVERQEQTITTKVLYIFNSGTTDSLSAIIDVAHYNPASWTEVETNIKNRAVTEQQRILYTLSVEALEPTIKTKINKVVTFIPAP